jgi:hypothetical protein
MWRVWRDQIQAIGVGQAVGLEGVTKGRERRAEAVVGAELSFGLVKAEERGLDRGGLGLERAQQGREGRGVGAEAGGALQLGDPALEPPQMGDALKLDPAHSGVEARPKSVRWSSNKA